MESKECSYRYTIGITYYNEPELLAKQIENLNLYPHQIQIILVDDGSQIHPARDYVEKITHPGFELWEVTEDLGFNSHGCRNLIATQAKSDTILFLDVDCLLSPENASYLQKVRYNPKKLYRFNAYNSQSFSYQMVPGHINVFMINKNTYWEAGGYDESFVGYHYGDRDFHKKIEAICETINIGKMGITVLRGGRKLIVDEKVNKTTYDDENMLLFTPKRLDHTLADKITTKLNFPYKRLL